MPRILVIGARLLTPRAVAIVGLLFTLAGAFVGYRGVYLTDDQAIDIGVMRINGNNRQEDLQLPAVQNLISQSRSASLGFKLILFGTVFQIFALVIPIRPATPIQPSS